MCGTNTASAARCQATCCDRHIPTSTQTAPTAAAGIAFSAAATAVWCRMCRRPASLSSATRPKAQQCTATTPTAGSCKPPTATGTQAAGPRPHLSNWAQQGSSGRKCLLGLLAPLQSSPALVALTHNAVHWAGVWGNAAAPPEGSTAQLGQAWCTMPAQVCCVDRVCSPAGQCPAQGWALGSIQGHWLSAAA